MANRFFPNTGKLFATHVMPVLVDCNFVVAAADAGGAGITNLKGPGVSNVWMHTSQTPATGNPNPASGVIVVQLPDNYNRLFSAFATVTSPTSGSALKIDNTALTAGVAYSITTLGNATAAQWATLGVPAGVTPAVGVAFIAANAGTSANTSTSRVMTAVTSGISSVEFVPHPDMAISPTPGLQSFGAQFILQCYNGSGAVTAPVDGSVIRLTLYLSNSSVKVAGE